MRCSVRLSRSFIVIMLKKNKVTSINKLFPLDYLNCRRGQIRNFKMMEQTRPATKKQFPSPIILVSACFRTSILRQ